MTLVLLSDLMQVNIERLAVINLLITRILIYVLLCHFVLVRFFSLDKYMNVASVRDTVTGR